MKTPSLVSAVCAAALCMGAVTVAGGELVPSAHAAEPTDERKRAYALVDEGIKLARAKNFDEAVRKFAEANRIYPHAEIQHNLARAHEELGRRDDDTAQLRSAFQWYTQALRQEYTYSADGRKRLTEIDKLLRKTHARVTVRATPSDVSVTLITAAGNEETHASIPFLTWTPAGAVTVIAKNPQFKTATRELTLSAGEDRGLDLVLEPLPKQGFLLVTTNVEGAKVVVDGVDLGETPLESLPYSTGVYQLELRADGYATYSEQVAIRPDELTTVSAVMLHADGAQDPPGSGPPTWVGATTLGAGIAAGGAGLAFYLVALDKNAQANKIPESNPPVPADEARFDALFGEAQDYQTYALISTIAGGALIAGGVVLLVIADDGPSESDGPETTLVPLLAPTGDGVTAGAAIRF